MAHSVRVSDIGLVMFSGHIAGSNCGRLRLPRLTAKRVEPVVSISWASCWLQIGNFLCQLSLPLSTFPLLTSAFVCTGSALTGIPALFILSACPNHFNPCCWFLSVAATFCYNCFLVSSFRQRIRAIRWSQLISVDNILRSCSCFTVQHSDPHKSTEKLIHKVLLTLVVKYVYILSSFPTTDEVLLILYSFVARSRRYQMLKVDEVTVHIT